MTGGWQNVKIAKDRICLGDNTLLITVVLWMREVSAQRKNGTHCDGVILDNQKPVKPFKSVISTHHLPPPQHMGKLNVGVTQSVVMFSWFESSSGNVMMDCRLRPLLSYESRSPGQMTFNQ